MLVVKEMIKRLVRKTSLYFMLQNRLASRRQRKELEIWQRTGRRAPPPHLIKQQVLEHYAREYELAVMVETGTYFGDMIEAMRGKFERVYSIELSPELANRAQHRFRKAGNVEVICGDSGSEIEKLVATLGRPALFWLDAHYSGGITARGRIDTPILEELRHIMMAAEKHHVIIIDDARNFGTDPAYPTLEKLERFVHQLRPDIDISIEFDSIRITPGRKVQVSATVD